MEAVNRALDLSTELSDKIVFLTGGMGGIGRACVDSFLAHGSRVAFTYATGTESTTQAHDLVAMHPDSLSAHPLDLRSLDSIDAALNDALTHWGDLDVLVNNAAVGSETVGTYADGPAEQDSAMLLINADGTLKTCQTFLALVNRSDPGASTTQKKLINVSSVGGGVQAFPGFRLSDGMSKAAVAQLTKQLAAELVHSTVDVFAVCPGATNTPMFQASTLDRMQPEERSEYLAKLPKGRLIDPSEIANIITFLASSYSTPMHGAVIDLSMGLGVRPGLITEQ